MKEFFPSRKLTRTGSEDRYGAGFATGFSPSAFVASHSVVHARAALLSENWPELPTATSNGLRGWTLPASIIRSGR